MKVILLQSVPALGTKGETKEVSVGYAKNYLFPKKLATTPERAKKLGVQQRKRNIAKPLSATETERIRKTLEQMVIHLTAKASDKGTLYSAISGDDIASHLRQCNLKYDVVSIKPAHIKEVGEHRIVVTVTNGLSATVLVIVSST